MNITSTTRTVRLTELEQRAAVQNIINQQLVFVETKDAIVFASGQ